LRSPPARDLCHGNLRRKSCHLYCSQILFALPLSVTHHNCPEVFAAIKSCPRYQPLRRRLVLPHRPETTPNPGAAARQVRFAALESAAEGGPDQPTGARLSQSMAAHVNFCIPTSYAPGPIRQNRLKGRFSQARLWLVATRARLSQNMATNLSCCIPMSYVPGTIRQNRLKPTKRRFSQMRPGLVDAIRMPCVATHAGYDDGAGTSNEKARPDFACPRSGRCGMIESRRGEQGMSRRKDTGNENQRQEA